MIAQEIKKYTKGVANFTFKHSVIVSTVERFFYSKLIDHLKACFPQSSELSRNFSSKLVQIQALEFKTIFDFLDVQATFRIQRSSLNTNGYQIAINELNKLRFLACPVDKLVF